MFGSIARFVTGKGREARAGMAKIENRDLMQAIVYGSFYVAAADGEVSEAELKKLSALISNMPALKGFGPELGDTMDRAEADFVNGGKRILPVAPVGGGVEAEAVVGELARDQRALARPREQHRHIGLAPRGVEEAR